ncbi:MAG: TrmB family transcriptional regulator [Patescibacteria group bacterium]
MSFPRKRESSEKVMFKDWIPGQVRDDSNFMEIKAYLEQLDISGKKADVYLASLELGSATVAQIAKKAGIKRTTGYDILEELEKEGLVSETKKGEKRLFVGEDPEKIQRKLHQKERLFSEILPQLKSIYNIAGDKPKIRFFEGKSGLMEVYEDTLRFGKEILAFGSYDIVPVLGHDWAESYIRRRKKKGVYYKGILPESSNLKREYLSRNQEQLRLTKTVSAEKYPFSVEINLYGFQKIALISPKEEMGIIIEGAEIYKTLRSIFELLWDNLPEIKLEK